ncbi:FAD-dependent oxidoreductase [Domibacillus indicus]|uniref:FAD-dependent oxidoreductase n=1 Tax=Domibacillus indicus TaxID=1437523 RepID=UPI00203B4173|nr:FAD-dependent oxidoreductase [Domibacillus indicus]MCM3790870.1 FAD-dependent oxidoreductase [Domibacillus indicus]
MTNEHVKKVLIVGGGISGLTAAIALAKNGIRAEIAEKTSEWNVYGVGIIQPPNALRALNEIGLAKECMKQGFSYSGFDYYTAQGHLLNDGDCPTIEGYPGVNGISRKKLHNILLDAVHQTETKIYMGTTVSRIEPLPEGVFVELSNGISGQYDLLLGSDGANSIVRKMIFGDVPQQYCGQGVWRYTLPRPKDIARGLFYYGRKAKAGLVPMSDDKMYLLVTTPEPGNPKMPADQLHTLLKERISEFGGIIKEYADQITDPSQVVYRPIFSHLIPQPWYKGRVLLVGDAAHGTAPHLGQGASLAIEDVIVLAELLKRNLSIENTLDQFMQERFERSRLIVEHSDQLVKWELDAWKGNLQKDVNITDYVNETLAEMNKPIISKLSTL